MPKKIVRFPCLSVVWNLAFYSLEVSSRNGSESGSGQGFLYSNSSRLINRFFFLKKNNLKLALSGLVPSCSAQKHKHILTQTQTQTQTHKIETKWTRKKEKKKEEDGERGGDTRWRERGHGVERGREGGRQWCMDEGGLEGLWPAARERMRVWRVMVMQG